MAKTNGFLEFSGSEWEAIVAMQIMSLAGFMADGNSFVQSCGRSFIAGGIFIVIAKIWIHFDKKKRPDLY